MDQALASAQTAASNEQPAPPSSEPVLLDALDSRWLDSQHRAAWDGLALLWSDPGGGMAIEAACKGEPGTGYACIRDTGSWARIRQLGLPLVLVLQGEDRYHLLLQGVDDSRLLVGEPSGQLTVARAAVEDQWLGAYYVAWPQASNWPREIVRGDTGPAVDTVIGLASRSGDSPYAGEPVFGAGFERWLVAYQRRFGLEADGIVGPKTLLYLIRPSISAPVLAAAWDEEP